MFAHDLVEGISPIKVIEIRARDGGLNPWIAINDSHTGVDQVHWATDFLKEESILEELRLSIWLLELFHEEVKLIDLSCNQVNSSLAAANDLGPSFLRGLALLQTNDLELVVNEDLKFGYALDSNHGVANVVSKNPLNGGISSLFEPCSQRKALLLWFLKELDTLILDQDLLDDIDLGRQLFRLLIVSVEPCADTIPLWAEELLHPLRFLIHADHHAGEVEAKELGESLLIIELLLSEVLGLNLVEFGFNTQLIDL